MKKPGRYKLARLEWERDYIYNAVNLHQGNLHQTALYLELSPNYLKKKVASLKRQERVARLLAAQKAYQLNRKESNQQKEIHDGTRTADAILPVRTLAREDAGDQ